LFSFACYPFDNIEAFKLVYPTARGGVDVGCVEISTLGANDRSLFPRRMGSVLVFGLTTANLDGVVFPTVF
jgi:hypothetical protein